jgi:hypothetical protein
MRRIPQLPSVQRHRKWTNGFNAIRTRDGMAMNVFYRATRCGWKGVDRESREGRRSCCLRGKDEQEDQGDQGVILPP